MPPTRITVLISGSGTNLQALINAISSSNLPNTTIVRVISNIKSAYGLTRASTASIPTHVFALGAAFKASHAQFHSDDSAMRCAYDAELASLLLADSPQLVVCAGWMRILSPAFLDPLAARGVAIINLHPALPGEYEGTRAIERAWGDFQQGKITRTGVMIHYVIREVDAGQPLLTREVEIRKGERLEELMERIHRVEHEAIVEGTRIAVERLSG